MRVAILCGSDFKGAWYVLGDPGVDFSALKTRFKEIVEDDGEVKVEGRTVALSRVILFNSSGPAKRAKFSTPEQREARRKELAAMKKNVAKPAKEEAAPEVVAEAEEPPAPKKARKKKS